MVFEKDEPEKFKVHQSFNTDSELAARIEKESRKYSSKSAMFRDVLDRVLK